MRYYIVNCKGKVLGENDTRERAEQEMVLMFTQEEIEQDGNTYYIMYIN